jgi:hypothetical protein
MRLARVSSLSVTKAASQEKARGKKKKMKRSISTVFVIKDTHDCCLSFSSDFFLLLSSELL